MPTVMATITSITSSWNSEHSTDGLVERDHELAVLRQCLHDAGAGAGGTVFFEAPPGGGKSRLLAAAREIARDSGMRVLAAAGAELERECPFCLVRRLFEPLRSAADDDPLLEHPAALPAALLDRSRRGGSTEADERQYSVIHGLFQTTQDLAGPGPNREQAQGLAILIDDLQYADRPSLRFLAYIAERVSKLPIAVVVAATPGERAAEPRELATLRRGAGRRLLRLAPLGVDGVGRVVRKRFAHADTEFSAECARVSGGNPFLLTELLAVLAEDDSAPTGAPASGTEEIVPDVVRDAVAARLESVPPDTRAVAEAVAVLGDAASVGRVAQLTTLDSEVVLVAARDLAAMHLLAPGISLSFAQPMLGTAIRAALTPFERAQAHLRAARILAREHAGAELIAEHLLQAPAEEDPAAVAPLREAAEAALGRGEAGRASCLLNRALAERPSDELRVQLGAELTAARASGLLIADDLEGALEICDRALPADRAQHSAPARAAINCIRAWALYEQGRITEAQAAAGAALDSATDGGGYAQAATAVLARCHIEQGDLAQAESVIAAVDRHGSRDSLLRALVLDVRAQLRLAQYRPQEALQDALHAGALLEEQLSDANPRSVAWRSSAALAHLALGAPQRARRLVKQELEDSRSAGLTKAVIRDLRILGLALGNEPRGVERLADAVAIGASHPSRLEHIRALIDYGAALRRSGRRAAAREPLRRGLDLSHRGGAGELESRARAELIAAGARPRRAALIGLESLTTSQRRVAEMAASGLTTRQIAGALFVTPKTVEFHLRNVYAKLQVSSREELAEQVPVTGSLPAAPGSDG